MNGFDKDYRFKNRYFIKGILTVATPLHIGSGDTTTHPDLIKTQEGESKEFIKISAVATDAQQKPYIPASTLKGNLRAWLATRISDERKITTLKQVFGCCVEENKTDAQSGKVDFWDIYLAKALMVEKPEYTFPYWRSEKQTGVQIGVTIDRHTRSARDERLFHWEVVPPGVSFEVCITGENLEDDEIALLLGGLEGFNDEKHPVTLGSETAQNQGKMHWRLSTLQCLDSKAAIAWLQKPDDKRQMWFHDLTQLEQTKQATLIKLSQKLVRADSTHPTLRLQLRLLFYTQSM